MELGKQILKLFYHQGIVLENKNIYALGRFDKISSLGMIQKIY